MELIGSIWCELSKAFFFLILFVFNAVAQNSDFGSVRNTPLQPGDVVYVDSGDAIDGGFVIRYDPETREKEIIASGGLLNLPFGVAMSAKGQLIVSDSGRLIQIEPSTGAQTLIADNSKGILGQPCGIAMERNNVIVAANLHNVVRVNPSSKQIRTACAGGMLHYPVCVAFASDATDLIVLNMAFPAEVLRVRPNGEQAIISRGGFLHYPQALAVSQNSIFVTDMVDPYGNFGIGRVIEVNALTGEQSVLAEAGYLTGPVGIAVDPAGKFLVVTDPYTINEESDDLFDGAIIKIDLQSGEQTLLTRGEGLATNPRGVLLVPEPHTN